MAAPLPYASRCKLGRNWKDGNRFEYCTTRELDLSPVFCVGLLEDIRSDVAGVSSILRVVAYEAPNGEQEQMLVCHGILQLAAEALET